MAVKSNGFPQIVETPNTRVVEFSFAPNNTSAVDQTTIKGKGVASVTRSAAGKFTCALTDSWTNLHSARADVRMSSDAVDLYAQLGAFTAGTTAANASIVVKLKTGSTNTDIAADADTIVSVRLVFSVA
jgi:hypothetical protein